MPKALEAKLRRQASQKGFSPEHADRYIYGSLRKMGWKPKRERGPTHLRRPKTQ